MTTTTTTTENPTMTTATTMTATEVYVAAAAAAEVADDAYDAATCSEACAATPGDHLADCPEGLALAARHAAHAAHDAAREAWLASDEPRDWEVYDETGRDTLHDVAPSDAEAAIEAWLTDGEWDTSEGTLHLTACAYPVDPTTGTKHDEGRVYGKVTIQPPIVACADASDHEWHSPYSVLGGIAENPGVWGHGGGVIIREVCAHCGTYRVTDTWAQDRSTGEQGLTEVSYEDADDASEAWVARRAARLAAERAEAL
jgi:hypothetical protein